MPAPLFLDGRNDTMPVPIDITTRPNLQGTVPIETAAEPLPPLPSGAAAIASSTPSARPHLAPAGTASAPIGQPSDVAGVLRRNQACLACRRRKLKCDAVRPHCSTCIRSYRHLLRTAPGTHPVLACEYDDATEREHNGDGDQHSPDGEDDDGGKKKRRKTTARSKKRDDDLDDERHRLTHRIAELEAQLAKKSASVEMGATDARWAAASGGAFFGPAAESPTTFLDMLSSAAADPQQPVGAPPPANLAGIVPSWASTDRSESTGLTPYFPMTDPSANDDSGAERPPALSPSGVFNFGSGPASQLPTALLQWPPSESPTDMNAPPMSWAPGTTEPTALQNVVREFGSLVGLGSVGGSGLSGPMVGPGASTPVRPAPPPPPGVGGGDKSMHADSVDDFAAARAKALEAELDATAAASGDPQTLVDLFWPGWPQNLPEPPVVTHFAETFFDAVPNMPRILHRGRFLSRLALPPTHSNFPHPSLLHAICAITASWVQQDEPSRPSPMSMSRAEFHSGIGPTGGSKPSSMPFSLRQAAFGKDAVLDGLNTGNRLFDVVRAMIILSRVFIDDTRMLECWTYCGLVSRMILPLGLNVRSAELSLKSVMLPPPMDALEREERRIVLWMAMYHDTIASAASGWGTSLALDELTVPLPVSMRDFDLGAEDMEANPQDLESLDLYIKHPVPDAFVMTLKGSVLLNRVSKFVRRWKNRRLRENDDLEGMQRPEFRELANAIACLQMSFPANLRDPGKVDENNNIDVNVVTAHVLPQTAIICLYEPFADVTDPNDQSAGRILNAARHTIHVVQQVIRVMPSGHGKLASIMHSASSVALVTAARTCLLFYRQALNVGDAAAAESFRADIESARAALGLYGLRFKLGYHHAQLIEYFLDRATNPTYEKLIAHYPEHPRPGALVLTPNSDFGVCILNALNIKRGYWRVPGPPGHPQANGHATSVHVASPNGSAASPASMPNLTNASSPAGSGANPSSVRSSLSMPAIAANGHHKGQGDPYGATQGNPLVTGSMDRKLE